MTTDNDDELRAIAIEVAEIREAIARLRARLVELGDREAELEAENLGLVVGGRVRLMGKCGRMPRGTVTEVASVGPLPGWVVVRYVNKAGEFTGSNVNAYSSAERVDASTPLGWPS